MGRERRTECKSHRGNTFLDSGVLFLARNASVVLRLGLALFLSDVQGHLIPVASPL